MPVLQTILSVILLSIMVEADPNCTTYGEESVVCTAGDSDYVLKRGLVSDNNKTTSIALRGCRITDIDKGAFKDLYSLKYLDLSRNAISTLHHFDEPLRELIHLNLSYNELTALPTGAFFSTINIEVLALRGNKLTNIVEKSISDLHNLKYVDISDNSLVVGNINPMSFQFGRNLQSFDISGNDASVMVFMLKSFFFWGEGLETLHLDRCNLLHVTHGMFSPLKAVKHLTLSGNRLKTILSDTFNDLLNLEMLDLSENIIDNIMDNAFKNNDKLKTIILRHNNLKVISEGVFRALPRLANLDLSYNLIEDVTTNAFSESPLRNLNLVGNRITYLQHNFCLGLRKSRATLRKFHFNQNPWQCACLNELLAEVKRYQIDYNTVKYDGKLPVCSVGDRFKCERDHDVNEHYINIYDRALEQYHLSNRQTE